MWAAFKCTALKLYTFLVLLIYIYIYIYATLLNLVNKLKCETNLILLST